MKFEDSNDMKLYCVSQLTSQDRLTLVLNQSVEFSNIT